MGRLPHVLLGTRTVQQANVGFSPAECGYVTDLVLPRQLSPASLLPDSSKMLQDFTTQLKANMAASAYPEPAWHLAVRKPQIPPALVKADHVFVRQGA